MLAKRAAGRQTSQEEIISDDSSSRGDDQFVISPRPRRVTRKASRGCGASSSWDDEEAARVAEGRVVAAAREAKASHVIQKVERPLMPNFEYTLRRVDRCHPCRPTNFTLVENQSMINRNEDPYDWTTELHDHRYWNNFQANWYLSIIKEQKNPITSQLYVDWNYMQKKHDPVFHRVIAKAQRLDIYDLLGMYQEWNTKLVAQFCTTAWRSGNGHEQTLNFSIEGHGFELRVAELPTIFAVADNDFHRLEIITERTIAENELASLYFPGTSTTLAQHMVYFPSTLSSTISSVTLSLQREVTAPTSGAQQGIFF
jgi:hypothetical protein